MLLLKRHLVQLVKAGKKRQTIRLWNRALLRTGQISYTPGLGKMLITAVEQLASLASLTEADALADGFPSLKDLLAEIRRIYGPGIPPGRSVFRIKFRWPLEGEPAAQIVIQIPPPKTIAKPIKKSKPQTAKAPAPAKQTQSTRAAMNADQREKLRAFLIAKSPGAQT